MPAKKTTKPKETTATKERKLDLFREVLPALDRRNLGWYGTLSDEQKKEYSPWLLQRYATAVENNPDAHEYFIQAFNERSNKHMNDLKNHPELLWMLQASCGVGRNYRRSWLGAGKRVPKDRVTEFISELYPAAGEEEIDLMRAINDEKDLREIAEQMNFKRSEIKEVFGDGR